MYAMIEAGLRGGMTQTTCKKVEANNRNLEWDDQITEEDIMNFKNGSMAYILEVDVE